ncbi:MAG: hypothetical protein OYH77_00835 [Pseudomonadota bacterium]|nr:hypothetical protein [Pseudomonadota bacterium]
MKPVLKVIHQAFFQPTTVGIDGIGKGITSISSVPSGYVPLPTRIPQCQSYRLVVNLSNT